MEWGLVVPVKALDVAKSRLVTRTAEDRADLALAFCEDTLRAVKGATSVRRTVVVTTDVRVAAVARALGAAVVPDPADGDLDAAVLAGAAELRSADPGLAVAGLVADLPALRSSELDDALDRASSVRRAYVRDGSGDGTTLVTATGGHELIVRFGPSSARRHEEAGLTAVSGELASVRADVDTDADLVVATSLGLGPATAAVLGTTANTP